MGARRTFAAVAAVAVCVALASTPPAGAQPSNAVVAGAGPLAPDPAVAHLAAEKGISLIGPPA